MPTIGVAVAIPDPWATQLQDYRIAIGDTTAHRIPAHITLIPPTEVEDEHLDEIDAHLRGATMRLPVFRTHLRGTGTFRPISPVVFVAVVDGIGHFEVLAGTIRSGPLDVDLAFPYHPHVTVAHDLGDAVLDRAFVELADFECQFDTTQVHLYVHDALAGWAPTRDFALCAPH